MWRRYGGDIGSRRLVPVFSRFKEWSKPFNIHIPNIKYKCDQCDFVSMTKNGLKIHSGKIHKQINQFDGNTTLE